MKLMAYARKGVAAMLAGTLAVSMCPAFALASEPINQNLYNLNSTDPTRTNTIGDDALARITGGISTQSSDIPINAKSTSGPMVNVTAPLKLYFGGVGNGWDMGSEALATSEGTFKNNTLAPIRLTSVNFTSGMASDNYDKPFVDDQKLTLKLSDASGNETPEAIGIDKGTPTTINSGFIINPNKSATFGFKLDADKTSETQAGKKANVKSDIADNGMTNYSFGDLVYTFEAEVFWVQNKTESEDGPVYGLNEVVSHSKSIIENGELSPYWNMYDTFVKDDGFSGNGYDLPASYEARVWTTQTYSTENGITNNYWPVRLIGLCQDGLIHEVTNENTGTTEKKWYTEASKRPAFTFEFIDILTTAPMNETLRRNGVDGDSYVGSDLRTNLTSGTIFNMFNQDKFVPAIKTVTQRVNTVRHGSTTEYIQDKIFINSVFSTTGIRQSSYNRGDLEGINENYEGIYGFYSYWITKSGSKILARMKKDKNGSSVSYWSRTVRGHADVSDCYCVFSTSGEHTNGSDSVGQRRNSADVFGVAPVFCL